MNSDDGLNASDEDRRLEAWLAKAPRLAPSAAFHRRVLGSLEPRQPWRRRVKRFLFSAHTLRWNVAGLAVVGTLTVFALGVGWRLQGSLPWTNETSQAVSVRFVLNRPDAARVRLAGDFTGWEARVPLVRQRDGSWQAQILLKPGDYEYAFVVDEGKWIQDPEATRFRNDGFGGRNALLSVPGAQDRDES